MTSNEIRGTDEVGSVNRLRPEPQMRSGLSAGLVGVVNKIGLDILPCVLGDDLGAVLVGADGSVRPEAVEYGAHNLIWLNGEGRVCVETRKCYVVVDS